MSECATNLDGALDRERLEAVYEALRPAYEAAQQRVYKELRTLLEGQGYAPTVKCRVKRFEAYFKKLQRNAERSGDEASAAITDLLGQRIVCPFLEDLEQVEALLTRHFEVVETVRKGAGHSFREFGYDSVHLVVRIDAPLLPEVLPGTARVCEIQLRTILQDAWAEVEHELVYKSDIALPNGSIRRKLAALNATLTLSDLTFQEIRDYQKELREKGRMRRQTLDERWGAPQIKIARLPHLAAPEAPEAEAERGGKPRPGLEGAMLEALEAHSGGDFAAAVRHYDRILAMVLDDPLRSLVHNHRGMAHFALAEYERASGDFSGALLYDPDNHRAYANRALVHRVLGEYDRSLADYEEALRIEPSRPDGYWGRAQTCFEMKLFSQALADCRKALSLQPDFSPAADLMKVIHRAMF